ncbi:MAG TPA: filamentous hemagglutinin N-terminal domain-containing protein, partial [Rhizomicrobium sp.]
MNKTSAALVRSLLLGTSCLSAIAAAPALAQPTGGTVTFGQGTITNHGGNSTVIDQKTGKLVINWDSFSVGAGGTVQFVQPGTGSIALNRVTGSEPTAIYGNLLANGQVWIINGNGVLFGAGSQIKVGGILATTADIRDADFAAGNYSFSGGTGASVVNQGTIQTRGGGSVVLSGASAQNRGLIVANTGSVVIGGASAFTVDFTGDGLIKYAITAPARTADNGQTGASNSGTIKAAGGQVVMTARAAADVQDAVVNNTGMISATSAHVRNGEVVLDGGDGNVAVAGTIDASGSGSGTTGGSVTVTGRNITVADNTRIDASGDAGGGTIRIGGDLHGQGTLPQAQNVDVGKATITADARRSGDGGTLVVWSTGTTDFSGIVSLKGGAGGGDGGLVETSGHNLHVASTATFDTRAPKGKAGTWLIDPDYIYIEDDGTAALDGGNDTVGDNPGGLDVIAPSTIIGALATTNVSLQAVHEIDVYNDIDYDSAHTLSLLAGADIYVAANVQNAGTGAINVIAGWDGTTTDPAHFLDPGVYGHSGQVFVTSDFERQPGLAEPPANEVHPVSVGSAGGTTTIAGSAVNIFAYYALSQIGYHGAGGGDIVVRATADVVLDGSWGFAAAIGNGLPEGGGAANVTGNIDIGAPGVLSLLAGEGAGAPWIGNRTSGPGIESGSVSLVVGGVTSNMSFGAPGSLGAMLLADLGTTAQAGSGGDVTFGITNPHTDYINADLGIGTMDYSSPHALTLLSTESITLPYSIQNSGTGDLTILAGWDPKVAPADVLTTPGAYGNPTSEISDNGGATGAHIWVVGASGGTLFDYNPGNPSGAFSIGASGVGTAIGSKGGTTTVGAAQIYIEGLSGYAQIGYHGDGGTGDINVIANGVPGTGDLTGIGACFDGDANVCVIGGRSGWGDNAGDPTYAQIGDLGFGVAGTASSNITISATGNIAISGGGNYASDDNGVPSGDAAVPDAYGQIGNGDASRTAVQTVSGTILVQSGGQTNFASSAAAGSP